MITVIIIKLSTAIIHHIQHKLPRSQNTLAYRQNGDLTDTSGEKETPGKRAYPGGVEIQLKLVLSTCK